MSQKTDTQLVDQQGIGYITSVFATVDCVLNEHTRETGIDAILEIRGKEYEGTGKFIAIQLKSGASFFQNESHDYYSIYVDNDHIEYWLRCCLPVMLIIYSPSLKKAYWTSIDKRLFVKTAKMYRIDMPKVNVLNQITKNTLLQFFYGKLYEDDKQYEEIYQDLRSLRCQVCPASSISALELYINGLMDNCSRLYFHTDLVTNIIAKKAPPQSDVAFDFPNSDFFIEYFRILNYHNLLVGDFSSEQETLNQRDMLPVFIKPLNINGYNFNDYLLKLDYQIHERFFVNCGTDITYFFVEE